MADESQFSPRRITDHFQAQLDTQALVMSARALEAAEQADRRSAEGFNLLRDDLREMKDDRARQHAMAEARFASIAKAQWTAAIGSVGVLAGWVFYLLTHQH